MKHLCHAWPLTPTLSPKGRGSNALLPLPLGEGWGEGQRAAEAAR
jgi:hypothetical protein